MSDLSEQYRAAIRNALRRAIASLPAEEDPALVEEICQHLLRLSNEQREAWLRTAARTGGFATCRQLTALAEAAAESDPQAMENAARAAVAAAEALSPQGNFERLAADTRAEAWAVLARALRIRGDLAAAEDALRRAQLHLVFGTEDPALAAKVLAVGGAIRMGRRRCRQAIEMLEEAGRLYASIDDQHQEGRMLLLKACALRLIDRLDEAASTVHAALERIDGERGPALKMSAYHNLAVYLEEAGQPEKALAVLQGAAPLYEQHARPLNQLRRSWIEGRLLAAVGSPAEAIARLDAVRRRFTDLGLAFEAALCALDLAAVLAEESQLAEVEKLATEMYPVFVAREIPREAAAALLLFAQAARARTATAASIRSIVERLKQIQRRRAA